jgi:hypothetical protein
MYETRSRTAACRGPGVLHAARPSARGYLGIGIRR